MLSLLYKRPIAINAIQFIKNFSTTSLFLKEAAAAKSATKVKTTKPKTKTSAKTKTLKPKKVTITEVKNAERPKRPISSFSLFFKENLSEFHTTGSGNRITTAMAAAAEKWRSLPDVTKEDYKRKAEPFRLEYEKAYKEWQSKYKKPLNGYNKFVKERMSQLKAQSLGENKEILKKVAKEWNTLTKEEKDTWSSKSI